MSVARGLFGGPPPRAGDASSGGGMSRAGWTTIGSIPLVASRGVERWATYRAIYLTVPWARASINKLSRNLGRLPIHTYSLDSRARKQRVRFDVATPGREGAGQKLDRLLQRPSGRMSRNAMYGGTLIDRLTYGNALWHLKDFTYGLPASVDRIRWRDMLRVIPGENLTPVGYQWRPWNGDSYGDIVTVDPSEVIHFGLGSDPEGSYGISPLESCRYTLALYEALIRHLIAYFQNSARPSGVFKVDDLTDQTIEDIQKMLIALHTTPENAGKILATTGTWQEIGHSPDHSSIVDLVRLSREEIVAVYSVPPPTVGILEQAIKSNVKELREQFARDALGPEASDFEAELMSQLITPRPQWAQFFAEFELAEQLRPDLEARALVYQRLQSIFSIDEMRGWENLAPLDIPGVSDVPWIPRGAQPLGALPPNPADKPVGSPDTDDQPELGEADDPPASK